MILIRSRRMKIRSKIFEELILTSSKILKSEINWWESIDMFSKCSRRKWMISISNVDVKINDFQIEYWTMFWFDIETIELMWENDWFAKKLDRIFEEYSSEKNVSNIDDQKFDFWLNDEVLIRSLLKYLIWCFLDDLNLIWWLDRIIFVTFCQSNEANLNQRSEKILLFVNRDYRVDSSVLSVL